MRFLFFRTIWIVALAAGWSAGLTAQTGQAPGGNVRRVVESVLPALAYGPPCTSEIEVRNLSDREVPVELEGHRASGALVGLAGFEGNLPRLAAHGRGHYKLDIAERTTEAWAKVREWIPPGGLPALAVSALSECLAGNELRSVRRDVAFPRLNPAFDSDVADVPRGVVSVINTSPVEVFVHVCYSSGNLYSVPRHNQRAGEFAPVCNLSFDLQIPPFGTREFPVARDGNSHLLLQTAGAGIVLEVLRPLDADIRLYRVDSSIQFGGELTGGRQ